MTIPATATIRLSYERVGLRWHCLLYVGKHTIPICMGRAFTKRGAALGAVTYLAARCEAQA